MSSQATVDKKRIAHIGNKIKSNDKVSSCDEDLVSEIIKSMDPKNKIISYKELEELRERSQNSCSFNPEVTNTGVKKYLLKKKHPLMEKCQKNLKYLKHNRSIPKQRAHVGEIIIPKNIKKVNPILNSNATVVLHKEKKVQEKKTKIISKKYKSIPCDKEKFELRSVPKSMEKLTAELSSVQKSVGKQTTELSSIQKSVDKQKVSNSSDSSDSDCGFEDFLREQKESLEWEESNSGVDSTSSKHKKNKRKVGKATKRKKNREERYFEKRESFTLNKYKSDSDSSSQKQHNKKKQKAGKHVRKNEISEESDVERAESLAMNTDMSDSDISFQKKHKKMKQRGDIQGKKKEVSEESSSDIDESLTFHMDISDPDSSETIITTPCLESNNDIKSNASDNVNSNLSLDLTKPDTKSYISKNFSCTVAVYRNPVLDEKAISSLRKDISKSDSTLSTNEKQSKFRYIPDQINVGNDPSLNELNSDEDECMIICEVPKLNNTSSVKEKSTESLLLKNNSIYTDVNKKMLYLVTGSEPQNINTQELENSSDIDIHDKDGAINPNKGFEIQILSVESLNSNLNKNENFAVNTKSNEEQRKATLNDRELISNVFSSNYFKNETTLDPMLLKKDFFKYAKTYSEPQNLIPDSTSLSSSVNSSNLNYDKARDSNINDYMCESAINECLNKIDLNLVNSTLKQASCSGHPWNKNCGAAVLDKNISLVQPKESAKLFDLNCDKNFEKPSTNGILNEDMCEKDIKPFLPSYILEIAQKIDFNEVLSLAKLQHNKNTENKGDWNIKSLSDPSVNIERNLITNSYNQSVISTTDPNFCDKPLSKTNNQKSVLHRGSGIQSIESCSQKLNNSMLELSNIFTTKVEKFNESPSDELDIIATENIQDLSEPLAKNLLSLFNLYKYEREKYKKIKSAEQNVSEGLKILEETQFEKLKYLEKSIQSVLYNDPCARELMNKVKFSKADSSLMNSKTVCTQETLKDAFKQTTSGEAVIIKKEAEVCNNCGLLAKMKCQSCEKVFFCSEKCGLKFWEDGHAENCRKTPHVKIENKV